uniref:SCAN box domain-containing protein n=1 Tax=Cyprinus carpio carpio TaxID=630221 RepID=A0A9J7XZU8_CYPCA
MTMWKPSYRSLKISQREAWPEDEWARALAPLLSGEAQRAYFSLPFAAAEDYNEVKREILARLGLSPVCAAQQFQEWEFKAQVPARAQAAELSRIAQHWLLEGSLTAAQVAERVVVDRLLRALPHNHRQAVGMRNPANIQELVEAIELADAVHHREAGDRAPPFPRRVVQARRPLEGAPRPVSRPTVPPPRDELMPSAEPPSPPRAWLAGCIVHQHVPSGAPEAEVTVEGKRFRALLDSGSAVTLIQSRLCPPPPEAARKATSRLPVYMETLTKYRPKESPFHHPKVPGRRRLAWWRICRWPYCWGGIGPASTDCSLPLLSLPAARGIVEDRDGLGHPATVRRCSPPTVGEKVSPPPSLLTYFMMCTNRRLEGARSPGNSGRMTDSSTVGHRCESWMERTSFPGPTLSHILSWKKACCTVSPSEGGRRKSC